MAHFWHQSQVPIRVYRSPGLIRLIQLELASNYCAAHAGTLHFDLTFIRLVCKPVGADDGEALAVCAARSGSLDNCGRAEPGMIAAVCSRSREVLLNGGVVVEVDVPSG